MLRRNRYPQLRSDMSYLRKADWFVCLGVKIKFGLKLCIDY